MHGSNSLAILYVNLSNALKEKKDTFPILQDASKEDFLNIFAIKRKYQNQEQKQVEATLFGKHLTVSLFGAILKAAKHHMVLKEVLSKEIGSVIEGEHEDNKEIHTSETFFKMMDFVAGSEKKNMLEILETIQKSCGLESFCEALSEADHSMIKDALRREIRELEDDQEKSKYEGFLEEIKEIERSIKLIELYKSSKDNYNFCNMVYLGRRKIVTNGAIVAGAICSVIAGLAFGGGCFAAGASLPILALIGIAVAAALVTGLVAGGITYTMLKPSESFNKVDLLEQVKLSEQIYSSLAV